MFDKYRAALKPACRRIGGAALAGIRDVAGLPQPEPKAEQASPVAPERAVDELEAAVWIASQFPNLSSIKRKPFRNPSNRTL